MAISSFSTLKSAVADWLDRDDMGDAIETMIGLCEARIYRELRLQAMEALTTDTIDLSDGSIDVPSDYLELMTVYISGTPVQVIEIRSIDWLHAHYPLRATDAKPQYMARFVNKFYFGPFPDSTYTVVFGYYKKLTALSTSNETNWFTANAPDMLLYGTLVHSAPYIKDDPRVPLWEAAFQEAKRQVIAQENQEVYPLNMPIAQSVR